MPTAIFWYRNDLRIHDNEAVLKALQKERKLKIEQDSGRLILMR